MATENKYTGYRPEWYCEGCRHFLREVKYDYDECGDEFFSYCTARNRKMSLPVLKTDCAGFSRKLMKLMKH